MTADIATLGIRIDSTDARTAARDLDNFQAAGARAERATSGLETAARKAEAALAFLGIGAGVAAIIKYADEYTKFTAQLKLATQSQREFTQAADDVRRIAAAAQQDLSATGMLYARIANGTRELGISQKNVADITETVNLALKVSGATSAEAASAMLQLSQSFASGTLRGEEFNAVNEAAPRLMKALADGIGVPVGALKDMASNGEITSKVMAQVLPQALQQLQLEAKNVQTISGAFTVLKNNVMEFTGTQAQANGTVAVLTGGIMLLADNLNLLMGVISTITAAKIATKFGEWAAGAYQSVTASRALIAANLATANSNAAATAAALATATAREAELRASVLAANGAVALAIAENGLIPQQVRAAAAAEAHTAALAAQAAAQRAASVGAGVLNGALSLLGGPIGAIVTLLGLAATAWAVWGRKSEEGNKQAAESFDEAHARIIKGLDEQIAKNEKLIQLQKLGMSQDKAEKDMPVLEQLGKYSALLNDINTRTGDYAPGKGKSETDVLMDRLKYMKYIGEEAEKLQKRNATAEEAAAVGPQAQALVAIRERLTGVNKQYLDDLKALQVARDSGAIKDKEYIAYVSQLATETWKGSEAGKAATTAAQKSAEAYKNLITSVREATATNRLELAAGVDASDSQKARIKLDQELASGKVKLSAAQLIVVRSALDEQEASEKALKSQRSVAAAIAELADQRRQDFATAAAEATANEQAAAAFGMTKAQIEALAVARLQDRLVHAADLELTADDIAQTERLIAVKQRSVDALTKADALGYIKQLTEENRKFAADSIIDERARAAALLEIDADVWRKRIALAGEGTEAQKALQEQFDTWYKNQSIKPMLDEQREAVKKYDDVFREGFADMLNHGKSGWKSFTQSLVTTFKTTVADQIYKMFAQPFVVRLVGSILGVTGAGTTTAGVEGAVASGATSAVGSAALGGLFGAGGLTGALAGGAGWLTGATSLTGALTAGTSLIGTGTLAGISSGVGMLAGALGPIALGVAGIMALANKWDSSGTIHTGGAASASATGVSNIDAGTLGFQHINTSEQTNTLTAQLASSIVSILDSTATTFGKTAGYTAATAFADDTSKDGAWGALIISNLNGIVSQWGDANSRWAPSVFADGEAGQKEYLAAMSKSVRSALDGIGLPGWAKTMLDGLGDAPALEDLAKVVDTINATQAALVTMGQRLTGFASLSDEAVSALLTASGGITTLSTNASAFYDAFYSDGEKTAVVTKQVADALQAVGLQMPTTRDGYRALVEAQLALGTSGADAVSVLLANAAAFAQAVPAVESATSAIHTAAQIESQRASLQDQLDELTMTQAQLAAKARAAIDGHNLALYDEVVAAQAAKDASTKLVDGLSTAYSNLSTVISAQKDALNAAYTDASDALQTGIDSASASITKLTSLSQSLQSTLDSMSDPGQDASLRQAAQAKIEAALAIAKAGGPLPDADSLKSALSVVSKDASSQFATALDYQRDLYRTKNAIAALGALTDDQLSAQESALEVLKEQKEVLDAAHKEEISALDKQLAAAKQQVDLLSGISTSLLTLPDALKALAVAVASAQKDSGVGTDSLTSLYQTLLGRTPDAAGLAYWQNVLAGGASITDIAKGIMSDYEYKGLHSSTPAFAAGGDHLGGLRLVGENGPELEATGPSRIFNANQTRSMLGSANEELLAEVRSLRAEMSELRVAADKTASNTETVSKVMKRAGGQGDFIVVKQAKEEATV